MEVKSKRRLVAFSTVVVVAIAVLLFREWQGPRLPGYRLEVRPLVQTVVATGRVITVSRVHVGSEITAVVRERRVEEGDLVEPGDVLLVLRADDLAARVREAEAALQQLQRSTRPQAQVALREAEIRLTQAEREAERRRDLFERSLIAREALEQAEQVEILARTITERTRLAAAALAPGNSEEALLQERLAATRAALEKTVVRAEVAGVVLTRHADPGDLVQPGDVVFEIARAGNTEILVPFDEKNLGLLALGQPAISIADAFPARPFKAEISFIAPRVDPQRGSVDVRLTVDPLPPFLRQDMTVSVNVETARRDQTLTVPNDALFDVSGDTAYVLAVRDGIVERVAVRVGLRGLTLSEIVSGLAAGEQVLAGGRDVAPEGGRVRVAEQALPVAVTGDDAVRRELPFRFE